VFELAQVVVLVVLLLGAAVVNVFRSEPAPVCYDPDTAVTMPCEEKKP
jgi:hypothetical protein